MVFSIRVRQPKSIAARLWNLTQNVSPIALITFIVLKLVRLIAWSWWWVLAPPWIGGILLAAVLVVVLAPFFRPRQGSSRAGLWASRQAAEALEKGRVRTAGGGQQLNLGARGEFQLSPPEARRVAVVAHVPPRMPPNSSQPSERAGVPTAR